MYVCVYVMYLMYVCMYLCNMYRHIRSPYVYNASHANVSLPISCFAFNTCSGSYGVNIVEYLVGYCSHTMSFATAIAATMLVGMVGGALGAATGAATATLRQAMSETRNHDSIAAVMVSPQWVAAGSGGEAEEHHITLHYIHACKHASHYITCIT